MDAGDAQALANTMWNRIQTRRFSSGTDSKPGMNQGERGMLDYYRGHHRLRFASDEFAEAYRSRYGGFTDNWCAPVIDATAERMNHLGIRVGSGTQVADAEFQRIMDANDGGRGLSEVFTVMLAASRAYALVWGNPDDEDTPLVTWEHPEFCAVARDPETRRTTASAKGWYESDTKGSLTLYTDDEVWKWDWAVQADSDPRKSLLWTPRQPGSDDTWPIKNPLGRNPMVEFRNTTLLDDKPLSDIAGVAAMQDAVNLVWGYLFNALDYASLPQRVVLGNEIPKVPILGADGTVVGERDVDMKDLKNKRFLWLTSEQSKIDSWPAAQLDVFAAVIEMAVDHISAQTRTPPHYLIGKMSNVAAESLTVAETGLVAKTMQRLQYADHPLRQMYSNIALAQNDAGKAKEAMSGKILWADPQYRALAQKVDAFIKLRDGGLPLEWLLEWLGEEPSEVQRIMGMIADEKVELKAEAVEDAAAMAEYATSAGAPYGITPPELP